MDTPAVHTALVQEVNRIPFSAKRLEDSILKLRVANEGTTWLLFQVVQQLTTDRCLQILRVLEPLVARWPTDLGAVLPSLTQLAVQRRETAIGVCELVLDRLSLGDSEAYFELVSTCVAQCSEKQLMDVVLRLRSKSVALKRSIVTTLQQMYLEKVVSLEVLAQATVALIAPAVVEEFLCKKQAITGLTVAVVGRLAVSPGSGGPLALPDAQLAFQALVYLLQVSHRLPLRQYFDSLSDTSAEMAQVWAGICALAAPASDGPARSADSPASQSGHRAIAVAQLLLESQPQAAEGLLETGLVALSKLLASPAPSLHSAVGLVDLVLVAVRKGLRVPAFPAQALVAKLSALLARYGSLSTNTLQAANVRAIHAVIEGLGRALAEMWSALPSDLAPLLQDLLFDPSRFPAGLSLAGHLACVAPDVVGRPLSPSLPDLYDYLVDSSRTPPKGTATVSSLRSHLGTAQALLALAPRLPQEMLEKVWESLFGGPGEGREAFLRSLGLAPSSTPADPATRANPPSNSGKGLTRLTLITLHLRILRQMGRLKDLSEVAVETPLGFAEAIENTEETFKAWNASAIDLLWATVFSWAVETTAATELSRAISGPSPTNQLDPTEKASIADTIVAKTVKSARLSEAVGSISSALRAAASSDTQRRLLDFVEEWTRVESALGASEAVGGFSLPAHQIFLNDAQPPDIGSILNGATKMTDLIAGLQAVAGALEALRSFTEPLPSVSGGNVMNFRPKRGGEAPSGRRRSTKPPKEPQAGSFESLGLYFVSPVEFSRQQELRLSARLPGGPKSPDLGPGPFAQILASGLVETLSSLSSSYSSFSIGLRRARGRKADGPEDPDFPALLLSARTLTIQSLSAIYGLLESLVEFARVEGPVTLAALVAAIGRGIIQKGYNLDGPTGEELTEAAAEGPRALGRVWAAFSAQANQTEDRGLFFSIVALLSSLTLGHFRRFDVGLLVWKGLKRVFPSSQAVTSTITFTRWAESGAFSRRSPGRAFDGAERSLAFALFLHTPPHQIFLRMHDILDAVDELVQNLEQEEHGELQSLAQSSALEYLNAILALCTATLENFVALRGQRTVDWGRLGALASAVRRAVEVSLALLLDPQRDISDLSFDWLWRAQASFFTGLGTLWQVSASLSIPAAIADPQQQGPLRTAGGEVLTLFDTLRVILAFIASPHAPPELNVVSAVKEVKIAAGKADGLVAKSKSTHPEFFRLSPDQQAQVDRLRNSLMPEKRPSKLRDTGEKARRSHRRGWRIEAKALTSKAWELTADSALDLSLWLLPPSYDPTALFETGEADSELSEAEPSSGEDQSLSDQEAGDDIEESAFMVVDTKASRKATAPVADSDSDDPMDET